MTRISEAKKIAKLEKLSGRIDAIKAIEKNLYRRSRWARYHARPSQVRAGAAKIWAVLNGKTYRAAVARADYAGPLRYRLASSTDSKAVAQ